MRYFDAGTFDFLRDLKANNDRAWFADNRERYEVKVKEPVLEFIADAGPELRKISRQLVADPRPVGGSMFRIHRDVRFSKDKSPYKTHVGAHFPFGGKDVHGPGYYLHLEPGGCFLAGGIWMPEPETLHRIREAIASEPAWAGIRGSLDRGEGALKRPPRGFDPDHPMIEDIKRKSFTASVRLTQRQVVQPDFMRTFVSGCTQLEPLMRFLASALGLRW
jgi:uncharacterized protein (TIGR02453 family)